MRKLSPEELLNEERRKQCGAYRELSVECCQCALHGNYRFYKNHKQTETAVQTGGLF